MQKAYHVFFVGILFFNVIFPLSAQTPKWKHFTGFDRINDMAADSNYLWLATTSCVLRLNLTDKSVVKYTAVDGILTHKGINSIAVAPSGNVFINSSLFQFTGFSYIRPNTQRWIKNYPSISKHISATKFSFDAEGNCWVAGNTTIKLAPNGTITNISNTGFLEVAIDSSGSAWFGTDGYVLKVDRLGNQTIFDQSNSTIPKDRIVDMIFDSSNQLWIATEDSGIVMFTGAEWKKYIVSNSGFATNNIMKFGIVEKKYLVAAVMSPENCSYPLLYKFDGSQFHLIQNTPFETGAEYVTAMESDRNGTLYISTRRSTLPTVIIPPRLFSYDGNIFSEISINSVNEMPYGAIDNIAVDSSGSVWVVSIFGGISKYNGSIWNHWDFRTDSLATVNGYNTIAIDRKNVVWSVSGSWAVSNRCTGGLFDGGVSFFNGTRWSTLSLQDGFNNSYSAILVDPINTKYFLSYDGTSNFSYDGLNWVPFANIPRTAAIDKAGAFWFVKNDTLFKYFKDAYTPYKIPSTNKASSNVSVGPDGSKWFTMGNFSYFDSSVVARFKDNTWKFYKELTHLENNNANQWGYAKIAVESADKVWIATNGSGLLCVDVSNASPNGIWTVYDPNFSPIGIAFIGDIQVDKFGNKWMSSDNGEGSIVQFNENGIVSTIEEEKSVSAEKNFSLSQNYPNPFNPSTTINYILPKDSHVNIVVFDMLGREVRTLVDEEKSAGSYKVEFNAVGLSSGVYFYQLHTNGFVQTKKLILMR